MKKFLCFSGIVATFAVAGAWTLRAQNSVYDTITITAPDRSASEGGSSAGLLDTGLFEIRRTGPTNYTLPVFYRISGTASNGVDYDQIADSVSIPAGSSTASILIKPIDDSLVEGYETVVLQIIPSPLACPAVNCGYYIGSPSNAIVTIADNDSHGTNQPPGVNIYATDSIATEGPSTTANAPDTARFTVRRSGDTSEGIVVYYSIGGTASNGDDYQKLTGEVTLAQGVASADIVVVPIDDNLVEDTETVVLTLIAPCPQCLYANPACEVPQGTNCYQIGPDNHATAYIRDNDQNHDTNARPIVKITAPSDGAVFPAPADIEIRAVAVDQDGYVPLVEFFDGNKKIGESQIVYIQAPPPGQATEFTFEYTNVLAGEHVLTARATDDQGAVGGFSPLVRIFVGETNRPPGSNAVTIIATDSIAVEGTFCYSNWWWTTSGTSNGWNTTSPGWRTNYCTTNTATFVVRRSGDTTSDLTVPYAIGGTASNGVDYLTLSGQVTIPAGQRGAQIVVVPIEDGITEHVETVVLALQPTASNTIGATSAYSLGYPSRAAAMILDNSEPRPPCQKLIDGLFHVCVPGTNGYTFCIRTSTDLQNWTAICTNVVTEGAVHFVDPDATDAHRFYDVKAEPNSSTGQ